MIIPLHHHVPMVFLWFSYSFRRVKMQVLIPLPSHGGPRLPLPADARSFGFVRHTLHGQPGGTTDGFLGPFQRILGVIFFLHMFSLISVI